MSARNCGCCACLAGSGAHVDVANRPGLTSIQYRVGTYSSMFEAMIRRLTVPVDEAEPTATYPLHKLTTRQPDDFSIALFDAWAAVGDVLTFYQERIANEAFLRTATERRSILELARLVGYVPKPGVSASVYLAYTLEDTAVTVIPAGTKAQSIPGANEQPQMFETSEDTTARGAWNALLPRMSKPLEITIDNVQRIPSIWIDGTTTRLDVRDPLLFAFELADNKTVYAMRRTLTTNIDSDHKRTEVALETVRPYYLNLAQVVAAALAVLEPPAPTPAKKAKKKAKSAAVVIVTPPSKPAPDRTDYEAYLQQILLGVPRATLIELLVELKRSKTVPPEIEAAAKALDSDAAPNVIESGAYVFEELLAPLIKSRAVPPANQWQVSRSLKSSLLPTSDYVPRLLTAFYPQLDHIIYTALANSASGARLQSQFRSVSVLRKRAAVFGYNAPTVLFEERPTGQGANPPTPMSVLESGNVLYLDTPDDAIAVGSYVVTQNGDGASVRKVLACESLPRTGYGISGKTTRLTLNDDWWTPTTSTGSNALVGLEANLTVIRNTSVLAESEELTLAQQPVVRPIGKTPKPDPTHSESETRIELDGVVDGLSAGRWVIVTGERLDIKGTSGVVSAELAMIDNVEQKTDAGPGGTPYSVMVLAPAGLAYEYKRDTVKIYGNVVKATNGETRSEILGAGDGSVPLQTFSLHQKPLTFVAAPTIAGVTSTLAIRVNDVLWHEVDSLADAAPNDRVFVTKTDDEGKVSVIFGNGLEGARLPTGPDNVRTVYRSGIGRGGNVRAGQVATAISRPLGVQNVVNPIEASGGADPESRDDARRSIPVSLQALGRVVSVSDYASFARTFAGIAKASAIALSDGRKRLVHLTIGGTGDIEIDSTSDLYRNLCDALRKFGDPYAPFVVAMREKIVIAGEARVRVDPDYLWADVAPAVRSALLDTFAYDRRDFGQAVYPSEVVAAIQRVPGVVYVDLDALGGIHSTDLVRFHAQELPKAPKGPVGQIALVEGGTTPGSTPPMTPQPKAAALIHPANGGQPRPHVKGVNPILPQLARRAHHGLQPAQIACLPPEVADLFILTEIAHE